MENRLETTIWGLGCRLDDIRQKNMEPEMKIGCIRRLKSADTIFGSIRAGVNTLPVYPNGVFI